MSLGEAAYRRVHSDIVSCTLAPGQRLTERALAESTGFGIAAIRDALTRLDHEGLVRTVPRKGYLVTPLTVKSVDDLFTVWHMIAPEIMRIGVREASPVHRRRAVSLATEIHELQSAGADGGEDAARRLVELGNELLQVMVTATDNEHLIAIFERLQHQVARVWSVMLTGDMPMPYLRFDETLIDVIRRGDSDEAAVCSQELIADAHRRVLRIISRWPSVVSSEITTLGG